jgi:leucyl/phenylalanyl-tRNA--protein transferase
MPRTVPLDPNTLLSAYAQGMFPMADRHGNIGWYSADPRGIIPLENFHIPGTLKSLVKKPPQLGGFEIRLNHDFAATMRACAQQRADGTWITEPLIAAYSRLHQLGFAHSVEAWKEGKLAGGLYGVSLGAAFFGESMFHTVRDASKVALVHLVNRLRERDFELLDTQATTEHLRKFGCVDIPAKEYLRRLEMALGKKREFEIRQMKHY